MIEIGQKFGKLTVVSKVENYISKSNLHCTAWRCKCDCGNEVIKLGRVLKRGWALSCGCSKSQDYPSHEKLYNVWISIKQRCNNPNDSSYSNYGGRGIKVCDKWINSYVAFREWAYKNGYNQSNSFYNSTIDRINVDGNYCPDNCRIVDRKVQNDNTTRTRYLTIDGETHTINEWATIKNINPHTLYMRLYKNHWDVKRAITTPTFTKYRNGRVKEKENNGIYEKRIESPE